MIFYKETNVFDEALNRIRMLFDTHDDIIISMSGGKDSTVLFNIALIVAKEKNRLPLKVFWLDQEAEWQHTVDYMDKIMRMPEVSPYWFQIPFDFTNSLSPQSNFVRVWDKTQESKWIHQKADISIKENPSQYNRFHDLVTYLPEYCTESNNCAVLVGMRISENLGRRIAILNNNAFFNGETWCRKKQGKVQVFWPVYDFLDDDIWTAIAKNHWNFDDDILKSIVDTKTLLNFLSKKYSCCLDFSCGYGEHLLQFKDFVACDIDRDCLTYLSILYQEKEKYYGKTENKN